MSSFFFFFGEPSTLQMPLFHITCTLTNVTPKHKRSSLQLSVRTKLNVELNSQQVQVLFPLIQHKRKAAPAINSLLVISAKVQWWCLVVYYTADTQKESLMRIGSCIWCQLLHTDIYYYVYTPLWIFPFLQPWLSTLPLLICLIHAPFSKSTSVYLLVHLVLSFALHPLDKSCLVSCFFPFFPSISAIIAFHPAEYGDGNNLTLPLPGDTILLWLIEVPSESQRRCRSSLSHLLTGNPLYCFIDRRQ